MPTLEDATRCPKCSMPGDKRSSQSARRGSTVFVYACLNERCSWFDTTWLVQVNADGSIPERTAGPKEYEPLTEFEKAAARRYLEDMQALDSPGAEIQLPGS